MSESDLELVHRTRRGDLSAYGTLIARHRVGLERYAMHLLGQREDAEEALQDSLIRAYRSIGQCRQPERFRSWLMRILVNRCRTAFARRGQLHQRMVEVESTDGVAVEHPARENDRQEEIRVGLAALAPDSREAFLLKHVEGFSYEEMVELTGASLSALKMRVSRACAQLRRDLEERHGE